MNAIARRIEGFRWIDNHIFETEGVRFYIDDVYGDTATDLPSIVVAKTRGFFEDYARELGDSPTRRVLEFGIWKGGSALALASLFEVDKLVAVDICEPVAGLEAIRGSTGLGRRVAPHYGTSQDDAEAIADILAAEFGGEPVDLIIDDASHDYALTKATFEHAFRHLRRGGWYVIEDWAWAHHRGWPWPKEKPALSNLVLRLNIMTVCRPDLFDRVVVRPNAVFLQKGPEATMDELLDLDASLELDGRTLSLF